MTNHVLDRPMWHALTTRQASHAYGNGLGVEIYTEYQQRLKVLNAADFGDLLSDFALATSDDICKDLEIPESGSGSLFRDNCAP